MDKVVWRVAAVAAVLTVAGAAPAAAQDFGGGTLTRATSPRGFSPIMGIALQQRGDRMAFRFETTLKCGDAVEAAMGRKEVPLAGARFSARSASVRRLNSDNDRVVFAWRLRARTDGTTVSGRVRITGVMFLDGRRIPCTAKPVRRFKARVGGAAPAGAPRPPARSAFGGLSDLVIAGLRGPVLLKVSSNGQRVGAIWSVVAKCGKLPRETFVNISPAARIKADGSFSRPERFKRFYRDAQVRFRVAFDGRFSGEGASGTFHATARVFSANGKRRLGTCDSGVHAWTAAQLR